jgi:hypothetical protein
MARRSAASKAASALGRRGGKARARVLSPERRREITVAAILARWARRLIVPPLAIVALSDGAACGRKNATDKFTATVGEGLSFSGSSSGRTVS